MKTIVCDICGKKIELKKGELFNLEIRTIETPKTYPESYDADYALEEDLCKSCFQKIKKHIKEIKSK